MTSGKRKFGVRSFQGLSPEIQSQIHFFGRYRRSNIFFLVTLHPKLDTFLYLVSEDPLVVAGALAVESLPFSEL